MFLLLNLRRKYFEFLLSLFLFRATNPSFKEVLSRIESHEDCRNLPMISFLILPMQRVTRLPLLMDVRHDLMALPLWVAVLLSIWLRKLFLLHLNQCTIALLQIPPTKCKCWKVSLCLISLEITFNLGLCGHSEDFRLYHSLNIFWNGKDISLLKTRGLDSVSSWATRHVSLSKSLNIFTFLRLITKIPSLEGSQRLWCFCCMWGWDTLKH